MNDSEIRRSEIKGLLRIQKKQGGVIPSKLESGTKILVESNEFIYEFTVFDAVDGRLYMLRTGSSLCSKDRNVVHIQSHSTRLKYDISDWIGKDMKLILKFKDGDSLMIGQIQGLTILGESNNGETYSYDFWKELDLP